MAEIVRISRDKQTVLIRQDGKYYQESVNLDGKNVFTVQRGGQSFDTLSSATTSGSWRRPTAEEKSRISFMAEKPKKKKTPGRTFRVPPVIQNSLSHSLEHDEFIHPEDVKYARELSSGSPASAQAIEWLKTRTSEVAKITAALGGEASSNWVAKFSNPQTLTAAGFVPEESHDYYAVGNDAEKPEKVFSLLVVAEDDTLHTWADGALFPLPDTIEDYDAPSIIEISDEDAQALANWMDDPSNAGEVFILTDIDPEERNLVDLAYSEIDWEEIDRLEVLTADATGYSPAERSENATRQQRANNGTFGGPQVPKGQTLGASLAKARLREPLPLVLDPAARIASYMAEITGESTDPEEAPVVASAAVQCTKCKKFALTGSDTCASHGGRRNTATIVAAGEEVAVEAETETQPLYFAIVDPVDTTAVLDVVSITPDDEGQASAWKRSGGEWAAAPELLADLQGDTPPPVVELETPDIAKDVLAQVDEYDAGSQDIVNDQTITASAATLSDFPQKQRKIDAVRGIAMPDGSYPIRNSDDLATAVSAFADNTDASVAHHIIKRAKALNRYDLVPASMRQLSMFDDGHLAPLYGEFGEVVGMVAAGGGNAEQLRQYWLNGRGAAKIRWGTDGDMTRCMRQLNKYMPGRAGGYCQNLHQRKFGVSNAERDNQ